MNSQPVPDSAIAAGIMPDEISPMGVWRSGRHFAAWLLIFALLAAGLTAVLSNEFWPKPLFSSAAAISGESCLKDRPKSFLIKLPGRPIEQIRIWAKASVVSPLIITADDALSNQLVASGTYTNAGWMALPFPEEASGPALLRLRFESTATDPGNAPQLSAALEKPNWEVAPAPGVRAIPLITFQFRWEATSFLAIWLALPLCMVLAYRYPALTPATIVSLSLCVFLTSILLWVRNYSWYYGHWDADDYGACAQHLANFLCGKEPKEVTAAFLKGYLHTTNCLLSAIIALPVALGAPLQLTYLWLSGICGFISVASFSHILSRALRLSAPAMLIGSLLFATHWLHIRSFARPIPDEFGLMLVVLMIALLLSRLEKQTTWQTVAISAMIFVLPLSRPPGFSFAAFLVAAVLAIDIYRTGSFSARSTIKTAISLCVIPALALASLYTAFHWQHNFQIQIRDTVKFGQALPKEMSIPTIIGVLQWIPLLWFVGRRALWKQPGLLLLCGWLGFYTVMLVAVRAPVMGRHFIPVLPVVAVLATVAFEQSQREIRRLAGALIVLTAAANLGVIVYQIFTPEVPASLRYYITSR